MTDRIQDTGIVRLAVYDLLGREVATLVNGWREPVAYQVTWNAAGFSGGVFFYRIIVKNADRRVMHEATRSLVLMK